MTTIPVQEPPLTRSDLRDELDRTLKHYATKADVANLKVWIVGLLLVVRAQCGWNGRGHRCGCADSVGRVAEMDARRKRDFEVLERFGRAFRDQTAEQIEEAVAQAVAEVRAENRREAERHPAPE